MYNAAEIFKKEAQVPDNLVDSVIDSPDEFLHEWWSVFYEVFTSRQGKDQETRPGSSSKVVPMMMTDNARDNAPPRIPQISMSEQRTPQFQVNSSFKNMMEQVVCVIPSTMYNKEHLGFLLENVEPSLHDLIKYNLKLFPGTKSQAQCISITNLFYLYFQNSGIGMLVGKDIPRDPLDVMQKIMLPLDGPHETKTKEAPNLVPLNGWLINCQVLKTQNQDPVLAQAIACIPENQSFTVLEHSSKCNTPKISEIESSDKDKQMVDQIITIVEHQHQQDQQMQMQSRSQNKRRKRKTTESIRLKESAQNHEDAAVEKPDYENVESFLSFENEHVDHKVAPFSNLKQISATCRNENKGFSFEEVGCLHLNKRKVSSHFSSDGKVLVSAGHEKKVFIWNMETFDCVTTTETHSLIVTDVRFRPCSTIFATSSFDRSVRLWDAARVRFQPCSGKFLATATRNNVKIVDVETDRLLYNLEGHVKDVLSICWDKSGNYIASVNENSACVWSLNEKCISELYSNGNNFQSCLFHPGYLNLLIIGGYQSLELWSPNESNKTWVVPAHKGLIIGPADSPEDELVASASHDHCVKLWK
ncbi:Transcriptional corepressor LEUNIG [Spatholobus suberectus]|nr:Transcriptional corepressor LEUNIG [Spatholobus suberectus]